MSCFWIRLHCRGSGWRGWVAGPGRGPLPVCTASHDELCSCAAEQTAARPLPCTGGSTPLGPTNQGGCTGQVNTQMCPFVCLLCVITVDCLCHCFTLPCCCCCVCVHVDAGSSTACLAVVDRASGQLTVANLGDSGFAVVRGGQSVLESSDQQHAFNFPFQLCKMGPEDSGNGDR